MRIEVRRLPHDQIGQVCELFTAVYGHPVNPQHWNWKYHEGPRLGSVNIGACTADGEWIGHIGASVFPGVLGTSGYAMAQVCDIMVKREGRGGLGEDAVYPRLVRALQQELAAGFANVYAYGFPGIRPFRLGERLGFYRSIVKCEAFQTSYARRPALQSAIWSASPAPWDIERLDRIWRKHLQADRPLQVSRTGAYMNWRYHDHPDRTYQLWFLRALFRDVGWLVTSKLPSGDVQVVDALIPTADTASAACSALVRALMDRGAPAPVTLVSWLPQAAALRQETPIVATEFKVGHWHPSSQDPRFQPADTDVN